MGQRFAKIEYHDDLGVRHALPPVFAEHPDGFGKLGAAHYPCGCQPAIHRFKCGYCENVVGWCCGATDDKPAACDECWKKHSSEKP